MASKDASDAVAGCLTMTFLGLVLLMSLTALVLSIIAL